MKRIFLFSAIILMQAFTVFAQNPTSRVNADKVSMYRQPGLSSEVMRVLNTDDEVVVLRRLNAEWTLVEINGEGGYVLNDFLKDKKSKKRGTASKKQSSNAPSASVQ